MVETPDFLKDAVSRRTFLARMTAAGLGTAAAALLAGCGGGGSNVTAATPAPARGTGMTTFADSGQLPRHPRPERERRRPELRADPRNPGSGPLPPGAEHRGRQAVATPLPADVSAYTQAVGNGSVSAALAPVGFLYLKQYAAVEAAHRDFLRTAIPTLGGTPVPANPKGYNAGLAPGADLGTILTLIRTVEEEGVRAYLGAAGFLTDLI